MFISDQLVYLELPKSGSSHIVKLLEAIVDGYTYGKHNRLSAEIVPQPRFLVGSIRDPWDWYVSMWAYGCEKQGDMYERLVRPRGLGGHGFRRSLWFGLASLACEYRRDPRRFGHVHGSVEDPELFREWLHLIHDPRNRHALSHDYGKSPMSRFGGFLTYRYLHLYSRDLDRLYARSVRTQDVVRRLLTDNCLLDFVIRTEHLADDLVAALGQCGIELDEAQRQVVYAGGRTNASRRSRRLEFFYDADTAELVRSREAPLVEMFQYAPPDLSPADAAG